jgi:signal transduction histidine kinase
MQAVSLNPSTLTAESALNPTRGDHAVQFYESDEFLAGVVSDYVSRGLAAGQPAVIIAAKPHREAFESQLMTRGIDLEGMREHGELFFVDAHEALTQFMVDGSPDADKFSTLIGGLLETASSGRRRVCAYGEMVDLLWRDGNTDAAIALEGLWNDIAGLYDFSLLCAYPMSNFQREAHGVQFEEVCRRHTHVIPSEAIPDGVEDPQALALEIAILQQRARALESEIERRKGLEKSLRDSEHDQAFLLHAATSLNQSLDYDDRLHEVAQLAIPRLADWCIVEITDEDPKRSRKLAAHTPEIPSEPATVPVVMPLVGADLPFGSIKFAFVDRLHTTGEVALAKEFARRASIAIENARLYRMAQDANRIKDQFLATLSHELRTPLTAILGWARMLNTGGLDHETVHTAFNSIERAAKTQASLIDDLLDLSKIVTGKMSLNREPVDLASIVGSALETLQLAAQSKAIRIPVAAPSQRAIVTGDPTRLQQIVWNLLSNALKFSEHGGTIRIAIERSGAVAHIVVSDEGRGIPPEFLPHVFDAFRQADGASTREHGGLGLGLAIVKYLAELHGGSVTASSEGEGRGATFVVTLPLAVAGS